MGTALFLFVPARGMERVTRLARTHSERNYGKETRAAWKLNSYSWFSIVRHFLFKIAVKFWFSTFNLGSPFFFSCSPIYCLWSRYFSRDLAEDRVSFGLA